MPVLVVIGGRAWWDESLVPLASGLTSRNRHFVPSSLSLSACAGMLDRRRTIERRSPDAVERGRSVSDATKVLAPRNRGVERPGVVIGSSMVRTDEQSQGSRVSRSARAWRAAVVTDDDATRRIVVPILESEGIEVDTEVTGRRSPHAGREPFDVFDLVVIDSDRIDSSGAGSMDALRESGSFRPEVVVLTSDPAIAVQAFDAGALDCVTKPVKPRRFRSSIWRTKERLRDRDRAAFLGTLLHERGQADFVEKRPPTGGWLRKILVRTSSSVVLVNVDDVTHIEAQSFYARAHTRASSHLVRRSLGWFEERLDPERFVRIHRKYIVNVDQIAEVKPWSRKAFEVVLSNGDMIRLSPARRGELEAALRQSI